LSADITSTGKKKASVLSKKKGAGLAKKIVNWAIFHPEEMRKWV
jgi:hypothetical protein